MKKYNVSFLDSDRNKVTVSIEFKETNSRKEISFSGECSNGIGQIVDRIKPANDAQSNLVNLWKEYHLNGMSAGTERQRQAIEGINDFNQQCECLLQIERGTGQHIPNVLKLWQHIQSLPSNYPFDNVAVIALDFQLAYTSEEKAKADKAMLIRKIFGITLLYDIDPANGELFHYGSKWIYKTLPADIEEQVKTIIDEIEEAEEERKGDSLENLTENQLLSLIDETTSFYDRDLELCAAIVRMFDLRENDLQDIEIDDTRVTVQGIEYLAGTDQEMDEEWDKSLDNYLDECILTEVPENVQRYFDTDKWKDDAKHDGRAHSLNRYDGNEESIEINGTLYFAYRQ
jgi:hypothetical protein